MRQNLEQTPVSHAARTEHGIDGRSHCCAVRLLTRVMLFRHCALSADRKKRKLNHVGQTRTTTTTLVASNRGEVAGVIIPCTRVSHVSLSEWAAAFAHAPAV